MNSSASPGLADPAPPTAWLEAADGRRLATTLYPAAQPWLYLLISHGFSEHRGWWAHVAQALSARGITVCTFDHFHHGQSSGPPGDVADYEALTGGLRLALERGLLPARVEDGPVVVLGHSNGGLVALRALGELPPGLVAGLVLSGPLLGLPWITVALGWPVAWLLNLLHPGLVFPLRPMPSRLTSNRALWPQYRRDPLRHSGISARYFMAMVGAMRRSMREATCGGIPLLVLTGGRELVVRIDHVRRWFRRVDSPDKERKRYPRLRHELFNEAGWESVVEDTVAWLAARFQAPVTRSAGAPRAPVGPRILHIDPERGWRGGQQQVAYLVEHLRDLGAECLLAARRGGPLLDYARRVGWPVVPIGGGPWAAIRLARLVGRERVAVVHAHSARAHNLGLLVKLLRPRVRLVVSRRVDFPRRRGWFSRWKYTTPLVERWIAISHQVRDILIGDGVPQERIEVVHSGVDPARQEPQPGDEARREALRAELGLDAGAFVVGHVGALVGHKDQATLLRALARVAAELPQARLFIAGEGDLRGALEGLIGELGLGGRVRLLGNISDVPLFLRILHLFVMPSREEGLGTSVLDAMAAGLPVVVTRAGGLPEMVTTHRNGLVVPREDPAALAEAILTMARDPALRELCAAHNRRDVARFSAHSTAERTLALYRALL